MIYKSYKDLTFIKQYQLNFDSLWESGIASYGINKKGTYLRNEYQYPGHSSIEKLIIDCKSKFCKFNNLHVDSGIFYTIEMQQLSPGMSSCNNLHLHCDGSSHLEDERYAILNFNENDRHGTTKFTANQIEAPNIVHFSNELMAKVLKVGHSMIEIPNRVLVGYDNTFPHQGFVATESQRRIFIRISNYAQNFTVINR